MHRKDIPDLQMSYLRLAHSNTRQNSLDPNPGLLNPRSVLMSLDRRGPFDDQTALNCSLPSSRSSTYGYLSSVSEDVASISHIAGMAITSSLGNTDPLNLFCMISPLQDHWSSVLLLVPFIPSCFFSYLTFILSSFSTGSSRNPVPCQISFPTSANAL